MSSTEGSGDVSEGVVTTLHVGGTLAAYVGPKCHAMPQEATATRSRGSRLVKLLGRKHLDALPRLRQ